MIPQIAVFSLLLVVCRARPYQILESGPLYAAPYEIIESKPQPYNFNIDVKDEYGTSLNRQEIGDDLGNKKGSYGYIDPFGISRQVEYIADDKGFRAIVKTNEPGTDNQNPADVEIISNAVPSTFSSSSSLNGISPSIPPNGVISINQRPQVALSTVLSTRSLGLGQGNYLPRGVSTSVYTPVPKYSASLSGIAVY